MGHHASGKKRRAKTGQNDYETSFFGFFFSSSDHSKGKRKHGGQGKRAGHIGDAAHDSGVRGRHRGSSAFLAPPPLRVISRSVMPEKE